MNLSVHGSSGNISGGNGQFSTEIESPTINANEDTDIPSFEISPKKRSGFCLQFVVYCACLISYIYKCRNNYTSTKTTNDKQQRPKKTRQVI